jgi:hypothetical protein
MKNRILPGLVTLIAIAGVLWYGERRSPRSYEEAETPLACIERMFQAAARGDAMAYRNCFTGSERQQVERSLGQVSADAAGQSLQSTIADLKGWAVVDPPRDTDAADCSLVVERVYAGRVDRQRMELRRESGGWRIHRVARADPIQPKIAYGTPVYAVEQPAAAEPPAAAATPSGPRGPVGPEPSPR